MFRKTVSLAFLCCFLCSPFLTGCGSSSPDNPKVTKDAGQRPGLTKGEDEKPDDKKKQ
ncbi:MAG: hypothetical protein HY040_08295 [Planctomycetes bacterium]|nr:hypothetical protein [Planctomycetota bacterium]